MFLALYFFFFSGSDRFGKDDRYEKKLDFNIDIGNDFVLIRVSDKGNG